MKFAMSFSKMVSDITSNEIVTSNKISYEQGRIDFINFWQENLEFLIKFFYMLDEDSQNCLIKVMKYYFGYSLLGEQGREEFAIFTDKEWSAIIDKAKSIHSIVEKSYALDKAELYILDGYSYSNICRVENGDTVFDCGAFTGESALYFSKMAGESGKIFCFEAHPETFSLLEKTIVNSGKTNIFPNNFAITDSTKNVSFSQNGTPGSRITSNGIEVRGISLDEYVRVNNIEKVDFIKMDIEGAELDALDGCREIIARFSPRLAICIYHKREDFIDIPKKVLELNKNYHFFMKHNSNVFYETVLFCKKMEGEYNIDIDNRELSISRNMWDTYNNLYKFKVYARNIRSKYLMMSYIKCLFEISQIKLDVIYANDFRYAYLPISYDKKLHYEFLFSGNNIKCCLHLEGRYSKYNYIQNDFQKLNEIPLELSCNYFRLGYEICYTVYQDDIYNFKLVASAMHHLILITFGVLCEKKLVSLDVFSNNYNVFYYPH